MKGAGLQNKMGALQGLTQAAVGFLGSDAGKNLFSGGTTDTTPSSYNFTPSSSLPTTFQTTGLFNNAPRSVAPQANALNFSSPSYSNYNDKLGLEGSYLYPDTPTQQQPGFYNGTDMNDWRSQSGLYDFKMSPNKSMLNPDDWRSGFFNNIH
jgi:hypothetical protein